MKNGQPKIEKGIPVPGFGRGTYTFLTKMTPGDSMFFEDADSLSIRNAAQHYFGKGCYAVRKEGTGVRLWRKAPAK
jgi:hypothetical protein